MNDYQYHYLFASPVSRISLLLLTFICLVLCVMSVVHSTGNGPNINVRHLFPFLNEGFGNV